MEYSDQSRLSCYEQAELEKKDQRSENEILLQKKFRWEKRNFHILQNERWSAFRIILLSAFLFLQIITTYYFKGTMCSLLTFIIYVFGAY